MPCSSSAAAHAGRRRRHAQAAGALRELSSSAFVGVAVVWWEWITVFLGWPLDMLLGLCMAIRSSTRCRPSYATAWPPPPLYPLALPRTPHY